ncbi:hypothetical protein WJX73_002197 [Symbiochloris irregularis]|uniref:Uncharacterized protein n=1 Tax=Symbiochloris irregularis TaxID=706552 RepID=A0AAW1PFA2_9CHLO
MLLSGPGAAKKLVRPHAGTVNRRHQCHFHLRPSLPHVADSLLIARGSDPSKQADLDDAAVEYEGLFIKQLAPCG